MNICVFCSSRDLGSAPFIDATSILGKWIAQNGHSLIYGGATGGLMDAIANSTQKYKGEIIGVIPTKIKEIGRMSTVCSKIIEVKDMSERKNVMQEISDVFVVMPGGIGTLDELFDTLSKTMLGYFNKKTIIVNINGYWDDLIKQLCVMTKKMLGETENNLSVTNCIDDLIDILKNEINNKQYKQINL